MKKQSLLLFCLLVCLTMVGRSQITTVYSQGFEAGEATNYTIVQGTATPQTSVAAAGARSLKLSHGANAVTVMLDTISLTNSTWQHFSLEFMHICNVDPSTCNRSSLVGVLEVRRPGVDNDWVKVSNNYYNVTEGAYSTDFFDRGSFCANAYDGWAATSVFNSMWRHERFDFDAYLANQTAVSRKLLVRFTLMARTASGSTNAGWYLDDVQLKVSADAMITPSLSMVDMPDAYAYPNSRGARIAADITTMVPQGMDADSVYVVYRVGSNPTEYRVTMTEMASIAHRYEVRLPFAGYDTVMYWHLVARDATSNRNTITYPTSSSAWSSFACVRGKENKQNLVQNVSSLGGSTDYPFPNYGDNRSEFVIDSAVLRAAGYAPGMITGMAFTTHQSVNSLQTRQRFQVRMANVPNNYTASNNGFFFNGFMKAVYDAPFNINAGTTSGSNINIAFQDTFFYAGQDILVRITYDNATTDPAATSVKVMPVANNSKKTVYVGGNNANLGSDFFNESSYDPNNIYITTGTTLPHVQLTAKVNLPLTYDCGISAMAYPSEYNASRSGVNDSVVVWLKNYGTNVIHSVPIYYVVDDGTPVAFTWQGTLAGGDSVRVRVSTTQQYTVGFHSICAWVGDTITVSGRYCRDHEPYNDSTCTDFIACSGALSGVLQVGGTNADYATLDNLLFSLSRCGVDAPLTVKLAPGVYGEMSIHAIPGSSTTNTVTFEPLSDSVWFEATPNMTTLIDLRTVSHVRFRNIGFVRPRTAANLQYLVRLSSNSNDCQFVNCWFEDKGANYMASLIASEGADSIVVDRCRMHGGLIGVNFTGNGPDNHSVDNSVLHSTFEGQTTNAIKALYQDYVVIDSNFLNNVSSSASYVLLLQGCSNSSRLTANKIYTSHGASAMGLAQLEGTAQAPVVIANNMVVCEDDGQALQMSTPVNFISATHTLFAYNSVRLNAPNRRNQAAVTMGNGAATLTNVRMVNNVIACVDGNNMAFSYDSRNATNTTVGHNVYYSNGGALNKHITMLCISLSDWQAQVPGDNSSIVVEPIFLNGSLVDLRAYNAAIKGCATPLTEVTTDMFGTARDATAPCAGALEFEALYYDFSIENLVSPEPEYCGSSSSIPLYVTLRNSGVRDFNPATAGAVMLHYRSGSLTGSTAVNCAVPAGDTATFFSTATMNLPGNPVGDVTYNLTLWLESTIDPNDANDTMNTSVVLHYHPTAPVVPSQTIPYSTTATLSVTSGITTWPVGIYNVGRRIPSTVYWYADSLATEPIHIGTSMTTSVLFDDTTFYVAQQRDMGMMKITEVQTSRTATGHTENYPEWFGSSTAFAVEMTNVGDYAVNLQGDTLQILSSSTTLNKIFVLPSITIQPSESIVFQFGNGTTSDSTRTIYLKINNSNTVPSSSTNFAVVYRDGGGLADVAAFNNITTSTVWNNIAVPAYLWTGTGVTLNSTMAGARRTGWPVNVNATPDNTKNYWTLASAERPMTMGTTDDSLIVYSGNVCEGDRARVNVSVLGRPTVDLAVSNPIVPEGCNLGDETLSITLTNFGIGSSSSFAVHCSDGTTTLTDVITAGLGAGQSRTHTFSQPLNMHAESDTTYNLTFWVEQYAGDNIRSNDTARCSVLSLYTPLIPNIAAVQSCAYGQTLTLTPQNFNPANQTFRWLDSEGNELAVGNSFTTPNLFSPDTFFVKGVSILPNHYQVGMGTTSTSPTSAMTPSPYNTVRKYAREQYIYTAAELIAAGVEPGNINSVSFYLDSLYGGRTSVTYANYTISLGSTTLDVFSSGGNNWLPTQEYYSSSNFVVNRTDGWIVHTLDNAYVWDGVSNIVVQVCRELTSTISTGLSTGYTTATNKTIYVSNNNTQVCGTTSAGQRSSNRPNIRFGQSAEHCDGSGKRVVVNLTGIPANEARIEWLPGIDTVSYSSCAGSSMTVRVVNLGSQAISSYQLRYRIDNNAWQSVTTSGSIAVGNYVNIPFTLQDMTPGRHGITVVVKAAGDAITSNDTIRTMARVRFCGGDYTVGATGDYSTIAEAVDSLNVVGIAGSVRFLIEPGNYTGQLQLIRIAGCSSQNTVTFRSSTAEAADVVISAAPTNANNYVVRFADSVSNVHFEYLTFCSRGTTNYNNVLTFFDAKDIHFDGSIVRVKGTADNANASCVVVNSGVDGLYFTNSVLDSGYYSIKSAVATPGTSRLLYVDNCRLTNFTSKGVDLSGVYQFTIERSTIQSGMRVSRRPLTGISVANSVGLLVISKNNVVLSDVQNGGKTGILIKSCRGASQSMDKVLIHNNMVSVSGSGNVGASTGATVVSSCLTIDDAASDSSRFVEVYFNTLRLYTSDNRNTTTTFVVGATARNLYVSNNIFSNFSGGYAYFVTPGASVVISDYNDYYSNQTSTTQRLAYWNGEVNTLAALQTANETDANSINVQPYFTTADDLHLTTSNLSGRALYNAEIPDDIDGTTRPQIPQPTIGAHEYPMPAHDVSVAVVSHPVLSDNIVEGDTIQVVASFYNNGSSTETNLTWYAAVPGVAVSATETISSIPSQGMVTDTTYIVMPIGIIDTQTVVVHLSVAGDLSTENNELSSRFILAPAFNINAQVATVSSGSPATGCNLQNAIVSLTLKNTGRKPITPAMQLTIGYQVILNTPNVTVPTLPIWHEEVINLPTTLAVNASQTVNFSTPANLYPTGLESNIAVKYRAWVHYDYDLVPSNDTTVFINKQSYYNPQPPVGVDLHIPYATTDVLWASQANEYPIRWYRDSTQSPFYNPTVYANSTHWNNAPRYFRDTVYYLNSVSPQGCPSAYSPIHVYLDPRVASDVAAIAILSPATGQVYVERDTVTVRIVNYSNRPISNIPVTYRFSIREGNNYNMISQINEVYTGTLQPDETVDYAFNTLLQIPANYFNTARNYRIEAWTDFAEEMVRRNDTVTTPYTFSTLAENTYCSATVANNDGMDITRISVNNIDWEMPPVGRGYVDMASYDNPTTGLITLPRGMVDTLIVACANSEDLSDTETPARLTVYVDYDRNGVFYSRKRLVNNDTVYDTNHVELVYNTLIHSNQTVQVPITIPASVHCGFMKARFILNQDTSVARNLPCSNVEHGNVVDWLLYIERDLPDVDLAPARIVTGHEHEVDASLHNVGFVMVNKGATELRAATIHYTFLNRFDGTTVSGSMPWTGVLSSGLSAYVTLPDYTFNPGTTDLTLVVSATGDNRPENDTLHYEFHRFHVQQLSVQDNFDGPDYWYAPSGNNDYNYNYWKLGYPSKSHIQGAYSNPRAWTTELTSTVRSGQRGTLSMLYSPYIDVSQIRPDSLSFYLARDLSAGSHMVLEYKNSHGVWTRFDTVAGITWYNSEAGFTGTTANYNYQLYRVPTSHLIGEFPSLLQFRLVYYTPVSSASASFGDGCAFDNFSIRRAQRAVDAGVLEITAPTDLTLGTTTSLTVTLINYGYDTLRSVPVAFRTYGSHLPREEVFVGTVAPNGGTALFTFSDASAITITSDYPEVFEICAFTRSSSDLYHDNDTAYRTYTMLPLERDVAMVSFPSPNSRVVAGDSVVVTLQVRNNGYGMISTLPVAVTVNNSVFFDTIDFVALMGRPLFSMEYFNYTISQHYRVNLGALTISAYCDLEDDAYRYNDTISMRVEGIYSLTDLKAKEVVINNRRVQLTVENLGSRVATSFEVGYYYDDDISTMVRQPFVGTLNAMSTGYIVFGNQLPQRAAPFERITAFVTIDGDADNDNDTTWTIATPHVDIQVNKVLVEENMNEDCRVRLQVENIGNFTHQGQFIIDAVINGTSITKISSRTIAPGAVYALDFDETIPKSRERSYVGIGSFVSSVDTNTANNQTSWVVVLNSFEDIPSVTTDDPYVLEQNYPNPFADMTKVSFTIPQPSNVRLFVIDAMGHLCYQRQQRCDAGRTTWSVSATEMRLSSGIYFYGIECDGRRLMRKMIVR